MMVEFQWVNNPTPLTQVPSHFTLPEELRPQLSDVSTDTSIPVIDLQGITSKDGEERFPPELVEQTSRACQEYGFFQVINHGVPEDLCDDMLRAAKELMESPPELKAKLFSEEILQDGRIFAGYLKTPSGEGGHQGRVRLWNEVFFHTWHPGKDMSAAEFPDFTSSYRDVLSKYAEEIAKLLSRLLSLISVSLGLDKDHIEGIHGESRILKAQANYYPPCPHPDLTLGLPVHSDVNTLTILRQSSDVCGLQVLVNGKWTSVEPVPGTFIVNLGDQLEVLSNARYKSVKHRAVTNKDNLRVSVAMFYEPGGDTLIGPIDQLVDDDHPPVYRKYLFKEFLQQFYKQDGVKRTMKEAFQLHPQGHDD